MKQKNYYNYKNDVFVIFGGAKDIGMCIAKSFFDSGAKVIVVDIEPIESEFFFFYQADLTNESDVKKLVEKILLKYKKIDVLINNVRGKRFKSDDALDFSLDVWMNSLSTILGGSYIVAKYFIPVMIKQKKGVILNLASISGNLIGDEDISYHVAKAGLIQFTKYISTKYGKFNIRANCISPGFIVKDQNLERFNNKENDDYKKTALLSHPLRRIGVVDDVAKAALFLCSDDASFITGQDFIVDGGLTNNDPWALANNIRNYLNNPNKERVYDSK
ncbi:SDR family oxidoreductase [Candidatus Woesearchaeota archaeon]|nr:SDR family oxidoreductase [Candidatus Woesearchaeota archaeon]MCF7900817.1 SDR family oxidoreductase [Candidatus Woesearchaeota archaeon]MCF8013119.1 SDR family oxidoreductase [Candidatus Woesearchaeota archaeon]